MTGAIRGIRTGNKAVLHAEFPYPGLVTPGLVTPPPGLVTPGLADPPPGLVTAGLVTPGRMFSGSPGWAVRRRPAAAAAG